MVWRAGDHPILHSEILSQQSKTKQASQLGSWGSEVVVWVKALATKSNGLSSVPGNTQGKRELTSKSRLLSVSLPVSIPNSPNLSLTHNENFKTGVFISYQLDWHYTIRSGSYEEVNTTMKKYFEGL